MTIGGGAGAFVRKKGDPTARGKGKGERDGPETHLPQEKGLSSLGMELFLGTGAREHGDQSTAKFPLGEKGKGRMGTSAYL